MKKEKISAIIVTYNSAEDILNCIKSIYKEDINTEIIVVDNNSLDNTVQQVSENFRKAKIISMPGNNGYAAGVNGGIAESSGELLLIINPDSQVLPRALDAMRQALTLPGVGAVGPVLIDQKGVMDPNSHRYQISWQVILFIILGMISKKLDIAPLRRYYYLKPTSEGSEQVGILSGSCMLVKKEVIMQVGGMDTSFFLFGEDIDFSLRIGQRGYKLYYQPRARVIHYVGHSRRSNLPQVIVEEVWSMARLTAKLDWGITSRIVFGLGVLLIPLRFIRLRPKRARQPGAKALKVGEMLKYLYAKIKMVGFPWKNVHQKENVFIKLG